MYILFEKNKPKRTASTLNISLFLRQMYITFVIILLLSCIISVSWNIMKKSWKYPGWCETAFQHRISWFQLPTVPFIKYPTSQRIHLGKQNNIELRDFDLIMFADNDDFVSELLSTVQFTGTYWHQYYPLDAKAPTLTHAGLFVSGPTAHRLASHPNAKWPTHVPLPDKNQHYVLESTLSGWLNDNVYECQGRTLFGVQFRNFNQVIHARGDARQVFVGALIQRNHVNQVLMNNTNTVWNNLAKYLCVAYDYRWYTWGIHLWKRFISFGHVTPENIQQTLATQSSNAMLCSRVCAEIYKELGLWEDKTMLPPAIVLPCDLVFPLQGNPVTHSLIQIK